MGLRLICLMQGILRESKTGKKTGDFTLFVECKVFFESEFVGFEVICIYHVCQSENFGELGSNGTFHNFTFSLPKEL